MSRQRRRSRSSRASRTTRPGSPASLARSRQPTEGYASRSSARAGSASRRSGASTASDPPRSISIEATSGLFRIAATCTVEPLDEGRSRIGVDADVEPRGLAKLAAGSHREGAAGRHPRHAGAAPQVGRGDARRLTSAGRATAGPRDGVGAPGTRSSRTRNSEFPTMICPWHLATPASPAAPVAPVPGESRRRARSRSLADLRPPRAGLAISPRRRPRALHAPRHVSPPFRVPGGPRCPSSPRPPAGSTRAASASAPASRRSSWSPPTSRQPPPWPSSSG